MLKELQKLMKKEKIDYYIVPTDDDHQSENVGEYFQARKYLSGFTGSAGTLLVTQKEAFLWTDGRYFIQAAKELRDDVKLMKMNTEGYPTLLEYLAKNVQSYQTVGFDGKTMNTKFVYNLMDSFTFDVNIECCDLITPVWKNRPEMSCNKAYLYDIQYHGIEANEKIDMIREYMEVNNCNAHVITALDDIAWIFNIRGSDIDSTPVVLAYALITMDDAYLYLQDEAYDEDIKNALKDQGVTIRDYYDIYDDVYEIEGTVLLDLANINYELMSMIQCDVVDGKNPSQYFKSIKNKVEIKNTINAHIKDGAAVTKFMYWLKKNIGKIDMDEISVADKLTEIREAMPLCLESSFPPISAYGENAALMHYHATKEHCAKLEPHGFYLVDSGGHYYDGSTDITRTFVLGEITDTMKKHFTLVFKGMMNLQRAKFLYGQTGIDLDCLARFPMWNEGIDYQCGTGHGVGHLLCIHEGPNEFRPKPRTGTPVALEAGMITTDEPGIYLEGQYGIRLENELLCQYDVKNEYGQFMSFKCLTMAPIDLDGINVDMLAYDEKEALNAYHQEVYEKVSPYLTEEEKEWLKEYTRKI